jgi:hypothetical protein
MSNKEEKLNEITDHLRTLPDYKLEKIIEILKTYGSKREGLQKIFDVIEEPEIEDL